jgi:hypothetical protein
MWVQPSDYWQMSQKTCTGEKITSSTNGAGETGYLHAKDCK